MNSQIIIVAVLLTMALAFLALWAWVIVATFRLVSRAGRKTDKARLTPLERRIARWEARNVGLKPLTWFWTGAMLFCGVMSAGTALGVIPSHTPVDRTVNLILAAFLFTMVPFGVLAARSLPYFPPRLRREMEKQRNQEAQQGGSTVSSEGAPSEEP